MQDELKTRSIRATDETIEKFKTICAEFENQGAALDNLIKSYEIQKAKGTLTDRQTEIADFEAHTQAIITAFLHSLEVTENTTERVRAEFKTLIESKDKQIISLQEKKEQLKAETENMKEKYAVLQNTNFEITKAVNTAEEKASKAEQETMEVKAALSDKQDIIDSLKNKITEYNGIKDKNTELQSRTAELEKEIQTCKAELEKDIIKIDVLEKKLDEIQRTHKQEIELITMQHEADKKQAVLDVKEKYQEKIESQIEKISVLNEKLSEIKSKKYGTDEDELNKQLDEGSIISCRAEIEGFETEEERNAYYKAIKATLIDVGYSTSTANKAAEALKKYIQSLND